MVSVKKSSRFEQKTILDKGFSRSFRELRQLESKINEKLGFWIFKKHNSKELMKKSQIEILPGGNLLNIYLVILS